MPQLLAGPNPKNRKIGDVDSMAAGGALAQQNAELQQQVAQLQHVLAGLQGQNQVAAGFVQQAMLQ